jgi:hypothetical protein
MQTELRLVRYATDQYDSNQPQYGVHQCYLDDTGKVIGRSPDAPYIQDNSADAMLVTLRAVLDALDKPVVDDANRTEALVILYDTPADPNAPSADALANPEYV